jgi:tetratricopeptide (TPR) repeat protein
MSDAPDPIELIQRGKVAARVGHTDQARELLRRAVELAPQRVDAWLALAGVEAEPAAKVACFERVLALEPDNVEARLALEMLQPRLERQPAADPDPADDLEAVIAEASRRLEKTVGPPPAGEVAPDDEVLYCANHPNVETMLRCNRCGKPICPRCAVQTAVGYRCKQCVGHQQAVFFTGGAGDYVIGGIVAVVLGGIASFLMGMLGYWFFALILGAPAGIGIAEVVRFFVRRRRSRYLWAVVGGGVVIGALPALLLSLTSLWSLLSLGIFLFLAIGAAAARLK